MFKLLGSILMGDKGTVLPDSVPSSVSTTVRDSRLLAEFGYSVKGYPKKGYCVEYRIDRIGTFPTQPILSPIVPFPSLPFPPLPARLDAEPPPTRHQCDLSMFDESKSEPLTEPDTNNHTKFYGNDQDAGYNGKFRLDGTATFEQHYGRLALLNEGIYTGKWADQSAKWRQDQLALFDAISGQLELTRYQKQIGRQQVDELDFRELTSPAVDTTLALIMLAAVVCRQDGRMYHPSRGDNTNDPLFVDYLSTFDYSEKAVHKAYQKVLDRVRL